MVHSVTPMSSLLIVCFDLTWIIPLRLYYHSITQDKLPFESGLPYHRTSCCGSLEPSINKNNPSVSNGPSCNLSRVRFACSSPSFIPPSQIPPTLFFPILWFYFQRYFAAPSSPTRMSSPFISLVTFPLEPCWRLPGRLQCLSPCANGVFSDITTTSDSPCYILRS